MDDLIFSFRFHGRTKGSIGIFYWITAEVTAGNREAAILKLYDTYDHCHRLHETKPPRQA